MDKESLLGAMVFLAELRHDFCMWEYDYLGMPQDERYECDTEWKGRITHFDDDDNTYDSVFHNKF